MEIVDDQRQLAEVLVAEGTVAVVCWKEHACGAGELVLGSWTGVDQGVEERAGSRRVFWRKVA